MLTQCPSCQTTFRITSEILRVAHGQVRCGRCHTQFDALERLVEEQDFEETGSGRFVKPSPPPEPIEVEEPSAQEDITLEGRRIEITGTYRVVDDPDEPVRQEVTEEWVEIEDLEQDDFSTAPDTNGIEVDEGTAEEAIEAIEEPAQDVAEVQESEQQRFARRLAGQRRRVVEAQVSEEELEDIAQRRGQRTPLVWKLLALPLVLLLAIQVVHHYRADLARHPGVGPTLVAVYDTLGVSLTPHWQLHAYEIKQWGILSDPTRPGTLKVRASVTNRADFPQPYPLLKLMLEDRWGDQVRARVFEPAEYLDPGLSGDRLLAPDDPVNATIDIVDPGPDAEGFRFDVCLRGRTADTVCAADVPR